MFRSLLAIQDIVRVRLVDTHDHVLSTYDRQIAIYATEQFQRQGIELVMGCRVSYYLFYFPLPMLWLVHDSAPFLTPRF